MPDGKALAKKAIEARDASIPKEYKLPESLYPLPKNRTKLPEASGIMSKKELEIIDLTMIPLAKAIADKKYSAVEVATAYCKAAAIAQQVSTPQWSAATLSVSCSPVDTEGLQELRLSTLLSPIRVVG